MKKEDQIILYFTGQMSTEEKIRFQNLLASDDKLKEEFDQYGELFQSIESEQLEVPSSNQRARFQSHLNFEIENLYRSKKSVNTKLGLVVILLTMIVLWIIWSSTQPSTTSSTVLDQQYAVQADADNFNRLVSDQRTSQRISGIYSLESHQTLAPDIVNALVDVLYNDESINVKLSVIESLDRYTNQEDVKQLLIKALKEIDIPIIRINIIGILTGRRLDNAIPEFKKLLEKDDLDETVRNELHAGLIQLI